MKPLNNNKEPNLTEAEWAEWCGCVVPECEGEYFKGMDDGYLAGLETVKKILIINGVDEDSKYIRIINQLKHEKTNAS